MKKQLYLGVCLVLCVSVCMGQSRWKFRNEDYVGVTSGQLGGYGSFQTVNGVYKGPWFVGLGAAVDYYEYRSVPLFVSGQRDLGRTGLFLRLDGGVDLPAYTRDASYEYTSSKFSAGSYWSGQLGYRIMLSHRRDKAFLVSGGYSMKMLKELQVGQAYYYGTTYGIIAPPPYTAPTTYHYSYSMRRYVVQVGIEL